MTSFGQRLSTLICMGIALYLAYGTSRYDKEWYGKLNRSSLTPPDWVFPIVWGALYVMIGIAALKLHSPPNSSTRKLAVKLFNLQLLANGLWSYLFFGKHQVLIALVDIFVMILSTAGCMWMAPSVRFWLLPYLIWIMFAAYLNFSIYQLNSQIDMSFSFKIK